MVRIPAKLECSEPTIDPGGRLRCRVLVYNAADLVDEAAATARGPFASFAVISPPSIALLPHTESAFDVTVELPVDARLEAGPHPLFVEVASGLAGTEPSLEELEVTVGRRTEADLSLEELPAGEAGGQSYEARIDNHSNHPLSVDVEAETRLRSTMSTPVLEVAPFASASMMISLEREPGDEEPADLTVRARTDGVDLEARALWTPPSEWMTEEVFPKPAPARELTPNSAPPPTPPPTPTPSAPTPARKGRPRWARIVGAFAVLAAMLVVSLALWLLLAASVDVSHFEELEQRSPRVTPDPWAMSWQAALNGLRYDIGRDGIDGHFGPFTTTATRQFQRDEGLPIDGRVNADDWAKMLERHRDRDIPTNVIGWREEVATELIESLHLWPVVVERRCARVDGVVVEAERSWRLVRLTIADSDAC